MGAVLRVRRLCRCGSGGAHDPRERGVRGAEYLASGFFGGLSGAEECGVSEIGRETSAVARRPDALDAICADAVDRVAVHLLLSPVDWLQEPMERLYSMFGLPN
jgi:hypothetical protein